MTRTTKITPEFLLAHKGTHPTDLAKMLYCRPESVSNAIRRYGLNPADYGQRVWPGFKRHITAEYLEANKTRTVRDVAQEIGCGWVYILRLYKHFGIQRDRVRQYAPRRPKTHHCPNGCPCKQLIQCQTAVTQGHRALCELHLPEDIND